MLTRTCWPSPLANQRPSQSQALPGDVAPGLCSLGGVEWGPKRMHRHKDAADGGVENPLLLGFRTKTWDPHVYVVV